MHERHEHEQYFFDESTLDRLADFVQGWPAPCALCAPMLGKRLAERGVAVTLLDVDERFSDVAGFRRFDLYRPQWQGDEFGLIVCDPPFYRVSLSQLFAAIRTLGRNDFRQPLLVSYLTRREAAVLGTFARFGLRPTGFYPTYVTVQPEPRNEVQFYGNLDDEQIAGLAGA